MPTLSNVHTERVFENELCELLPANGGFVRTHLQDAKFYSRVASPLFRRPACIFPGYPLKEHAQARSNTEQKFGMSDFKDIMMDIIIDGQESHNKIAGQLLQDERTFAIMQGMLAKMVFDGFKRAAAQSQAV